MKAKPCYLLMGSDDPSEASFCESVNAAKAQYKRAAYELAKYEQALEARVYLVEKQGDDFDPDAPDWVLSLGTRGGVVQQAC